MEHRSWTVDDWKGVAWSDEPKVTRLGSGKRKWEWRRPGRVLTEQHVQGTVKFGGGSLMMWGCMTAQGAGRVCRIEGGLNAQLYMHILDSQLL